jgi:hypothetical protein
MSNVPVAMAKELSKQYLIDQAKAYGSSLFLWGLVIGFLETEGEKGVLVETSLQSLNMSLARALGDLTAATQSEQPKGGRP